VTRGFYQPIVMIFGIFLVGLACFMAIPAVVDAA